LSANCYNILGHDFSNFWKISEQQFDFGPSTLQVLPTFAASFFLDFLPMLPSVPGMELSSWFPSQFVL